MRATPAHLEVVDFIATGPTPERLAAFRPSNAARERVMHRFSGKKPESSCLRKHPSWMNTSSWSI